MMRKLLTAAALICCAGAAHAAEDGLYIGAGITDAKLDNISAPRSGLRIDDTSWKGFLGFKFPAIPIGIETDYIDLGTTTHSTPSSTSDASAKAFAAYAVGYLPLPIPFLDFYGKAGLARWQLDANTPSGLFDLHTRGTEFAWGAGAQAHFSRFAVRLEFENFNIQNTDGAKLWSLGAAYYFL